MALRNISNIRQTQNIHDLFFYTNNQHQQQQEQHRHHHQIGKSLLNYQQHNNNNNNIENKMKPQQIIKPATSVTSICSTTSSTGSTKSASSIKIRTSSPISSTESSTSSQSSSTEISPSKFMNAVREHKSRQQQQQQQQQQQPQLGHFVSMKELAFEKLKKQQLIEHDLKNTFNLHNQMNARQLDQSVRLKSSGKLKCAIYNNLNHLTVHIIEARQLKSDPSSSSSHLNNTQPFDTYVKITMLPDVEQRFNKYQTPLTKCIPSTNSTSSLSNASSNASSSSNTNLDFTTNFYYDQKFSFEFDQMTDMNNRLIVSVWSHMHTLIGCFSFKIKHLIKANFKEATWYHLIPLKYGMSKHLVSKSEMKPQRNYHHQLGCQKKTYKSQSDLVSNLNKDLQGMQRIGLSVVRGNEQESFGFTVTNSCPCAVGKVEMGKSGHRAGLRVGDFISHVNGINVSRATCETVVKMIKACKLRLDVEIYREQTIIEASLCQGVTDSNDIDFIATKLLNSHLEFQQKLANKNYENCVNDLNLESIGYRLPEQQPPQPPQTQLQQFHHHHQNINVNQFGLEVVLEEDEEANEISDVEDDENDYQDLDMDVNEDKDYIGYMHVEQRLRHVDSSSNEDDDQYFAQKEAELLRKAAQQFYSNKNGEGIKKANIISLRNDQQQHAFNYF